MPLIDRQKYKHVIYNYLLESSITADVDNDGDLESVASYAGGGVLAGYGYRHAHAGKGHMVAVLDRFYPLSGALGHLGPDPACMGFQAKVVHGFVADEGLLSATLTHKWLERNPSIVTGFKARLVEFLETASKSDMNLTAVFADMLGDFADLIKSLIFGDDQSRSISQFLISGAFLFQQGKAFLPEKEISSYDGIELNKVSYTLSKTYVTLTAVPGLSAPTKAVKDASYLMLFPGLIGLGYNPLNDKSGKIFYLGSKMIGGDPKYILEKGGDHLNYYINALAAAIFNEIITYQILYRIEEQAPDRYGNCKELWFAAANIYIGRDIDYNTQQINNFSKNVINPENLSTNSIAAGLHTAIGRAIITFLVTTTNITQNQSVIAEHKIGNVYPGMCFEALAKMFPQSYGYDSTLIRQPKQLKEMVIDPAIKKVIAILSLKTKDNKPFIQLEARKRDSRPEEAYFTFLGFAGGTPNFDSLSKDMQELLTIIGGDVPAWALGREGAEMTAGTEEFNELMRKFGVLIALPPGQYRFVHNYRAVIAALWNNKPCVQITSPSDELEKIKYKISFYGFFLRNVFRNAFTQAGIGGGLLYLIPTEVSFSNAETYVYAPNTQAYGSYGYPLWTKLNVTLEPFNDWIFFFGNYIGLDVLAKALKVIEYTISATETPPEK